MDTLNHFRQYEEYKDYDIAAKLVADGGMGVLPRNLGGHGILMEINHKEMGFCWALVSEDSPIAFIEYYTIEESHRGDIALANALVSKVISDLIVMDKKKILGAVHKNAPHADALARLYNHMGGMVVRDSYTVCGDAGEILANLRRRAA